MPISAEARFTFDVIGYVHRRGATAADELRDYRRWMSGASKRVEPALS